MTLYFGDIGESSKTFTSYFERNGARPCGQDENPAEWMLGITGAAPGSQCTQDWPAIWNASDERKAVKAELAHMKETLSPRLLSINDTDASRSFATGFGTQLCTVLVRVFQQYWRTPSYLYSKVALCLFSVSRIQFQCTKQGTLIVHRLCSSASPFGKHPTRSRGCKINSTPSSCCSVSSPTFAHRLYLIFWNKEHFTKSERGKLRRTPGKFSSCQTC